MRLADQPSCFPSELVVAVSSRSDGTMLNRNGDFHSEDVVKNRSSFCKLAGLDYEKCVYQLVSYGENESFREITDVSSPDTAQNRKQVHGDGLFTDEPGVGLFLPVADCVATVLYDPKKRFLGMFHLGRHSTYADLSTCAVMYFTEKGSNPSDLIVWMSPSAGPASYRLSWFDRVDAPDWRGYFEKRDDGYCLDLAGYNSARFAAAGVLDQNIFVSSVDTVTDPEYFSHQSGETDSRIAVVAMMK